MPRADRTSNDHFAGVVRGWLCKRCNTAIGLLGDNAGGVQRALDYLQRDPLSVDAIIVSDKDADLERYIAALGTPNS